MERKAEGHDALNQYETTNLILRQILLAYHRATEELQSISMQLQGQVAAASKRFGPVLEALIQMSVNRSSSLCIGALEVSPKQTALAENPTLRPMATPAIPTLVSCQPNK